MPPRRKKTKSQKNKSKKIKRADVRKWNALWHACMMSDWDTMRTILAHNHFSERLINRTGWVQGIEDDDEVQGGTLLTNAIRRDAPNDIIESLLMHGANPNKPDEQGNTALVASVYHRIPAGRNDYISQLLHHGAKPNLPGYSNENALALATAVGANDISDRLLQNNAGTVQALRSVNAPPPNQLVHPLAREIVKQHSRYPMHDALRAGNVQLFRELLDMGYDPNELDTSGSTVIHAAAQGGVMKELMEILGHDSLQRKQKRRFGGRITKKMRT